jgi:hypothetical protein
LKEVEQAMTRSSRIGALGSWVGLFLVVGLLAAPNVATSVDRAFQVGGRYEFHPLNAAGPYRDNACTATHLIGGAGVDGDGQGLPHAGEGGQRPVWWRLGGAGGVVVRCWPPVVPGLSAGGCDGGVR